MSFLADIDPNIALIVGATVTALGPTIAGLAAWNSSRQNASQRSVDVLDDKVKELHDCLDRHTRTDTENFEKIDQRFSEADADRSTFHKTLARIESSVKETE